MRRVWSDKEVTGGKAQAGGRGRVGRGEAQPVRSMAATATASVGARRAVKRAAWGHSHSGTMQRRGTVQSAKLANTTRNARDRA